LRRIGYRDSSFKPVVDAPKCTLTRVSGFEFAV
jgi:hypothetical protein